jgi:hypothetical protein
MLCEAQSTAEVIGAAGRGGRRSPMPQAASNKAMDGNARIRAEGRRSSVSVICRAGD